LQVLRLPKNKGRQELGAFSSRWRPGWPGDRWSP